MTEVLTYPNGLRVVVSNNSSIRSVSCGIWAGVGSNLEDANNNGISHFTEHMMFKGTDKLSAFDIANEFESLGAMINAFTSKEMTCYYFMSVDEYLEKGFSLLSHIFFDSTFDEGELDKERKVIVEEINMVEDTPSDISRDKIHEAVYGNKGLGRTILGPIENVLRFNGDDVRAHIKKYYTATNLVVTFSGNVTVELADKLVRRYLLDRVNCDNIAFPKTENTQNSRVYLDRIKDFEQSSIEISFPAFAIDDQRATALRAFNVVMGGGMSSRLFQSVRERQGLAYSVYSSPSVFSNAGTYEISLNISKENTEKSVKAVKEEIDKFLCDGITQSELERTKVQLKSSTVFGNESAMNVMIANGKKMLLTGKLVNIDEIIEEIGALTKNDVDSVAKTVLDYSKVCSAYVGKECGVNILDLLK